MDPQRFEICATYLGESVETNEVPSGLFGTTEWNPADWLGESLEDGVSGDR